MINFEKAKELILEAKQINILPAVQLKNDAFLSALGLFYSLKELGKNANILLKTPAQNYTKLLNEKYLHSMGTDFLISIKTNNHSASELFYEKTSQSLNIFLKLNNPTLTTNDFDLTDLRQSDLLITIGTESAHTVGDFLKQRPKNIINIDNSPNNDLFGDVNLTLPENVSLAEIIFKLICQISPTEDVEMWTATSLLAAITEQTLSWQNHLTKEVLETAQYLLQSQADIEKVISVLPQNSQRQKTGLFLQGLKNLKQENQNTTTTHINPNDFQALQAGPTDLLFSLKKFASDVFNFENFFLLWQSINNSAETNGVFYSKNENVVNQLAKKLNSQKKGQGFLFKEPFSDIQLAKSHILRFLKEMS